MKIKQNNKQTMTSSTTITERFNKYFEKYGKLPPTPIKIINTPKSDKKNNIPSLVRFTNNVVENFPETNPVVTVLLPFKDNSPLVFPPIIPTTIIPTTIIPTTIIPTTTVVRLEKFKQNNPLVFPFKEEEDKKITPVVFPPIIATTTSFVRLEKFKKNNPLVFPFKEEEEVPLTAFKNSPNDFSFFNNLSSSDVNFLKKRNHHYNEILNKLKDLQKAKTNNNKKQLVIEQLKLKVKEKWLHDLKQLEFFLKKNSHYENLINLLLS